MIRMRGDSSTSITYLGSNCTVSDPVTGKCLPNVFFGDDSNQDGGSGDGTGSGMPGDPGAQAALNEFAASSTAAADSFALNHSATASGNIGFGLLPIDSPLSLPVSIANPLNKLLLYGGVAIVALYMITESNIRKAQRSR